MLVSIITPVYKGEKYISGLLDMVLANYKTLTEQLPDAQLELLLVNDYPEQPLTVNAQEFPFLVQVLENPRNLGIHGARVNGLKYARGEYIQFLDQDDTISDHCILSHLQTIGEADVSVGNGYKMHGEQKRRIYRNLHKHRLATKLKYYLYAACQIVSPGHCLICRNAIPEVWLNHIVTKNGGDDLFLWLLMFCSGARFVINPECVYTHVDTGKNVSSSQSTMIRSAYNVIELMKQCGQIPDKVICAYERRIRMLEAISHGSKPQKALACLRNLDICLCKLYAYYR